MAGLSLYVRSRSTGFLRFLFNLCGVQWVPLPIQEAGNSQYVSVTLFSGSGGVYRQGSHVFYLVLRNVLRRSILSETL